MTEYGTVVELKEGKAVVEIGQSGQCSRCRACACMGAGTMRVELDAIPGLSVGDRVEVDVHISQMKAALTLFALPLAAVLLGVLLGNWLSGNYFPDTRFPGLPAILLALVFVSLTYLGVYLYERKAAKTRKPPTIRKADSGPSGSPDGNPAG